MPTKAVAQLAIDENVIEDAELEAALEDRAKRKNSASELTRQYQEAHDKAIGLIEAKGLIVPEDGALRIGRFRVSKAISKPRSVTFETAEKSRIAISEQE